MPRVTAKQQPSERGLARVVQGPRGFIINVDGMRVGSVSPLRGERRLYDGWYWYASVGGESRNTSSEKPHKTKEAARDAAIAWVKTKLAARSSSE